MECFYCKKSIDEGNVVNVRKSGIDGLIKASEHRNDCLVDVFRNAKDNNSVITVHTECRRLYTHPNIYRKVFDKNRDAEVSEASLPSPKLRSSVKPFDIKSDCLFCGQEASVRKETKKSAKYRRVIHEVQTISFKNTVISQANERNDDWGETVRARAMNEKDLVAAEAKFHHLCSTKFFSKDAQLDKNNDRRGRPADMEKQSAFSKLIQFIDDSDECQFSIYELMNVMDDSDMYTGEYLKRLILDYYGDSVFITEIEGKPSILNFKGSSNAVLYEKWQNERKKLGRDDLLGMVEMVGSIIREDIRSKAYNLDTYPSPDADMNDVDQIPESLQIFLRTVITTKGKSDSSIDRKRAAIGQALISACRPRSFISPVLLGVGVYAHSYFASRDLVNRLSKLCFSVDYAEVKRYEYSVMEEQSSGKVEKDKNCYLQYAFDNADFNVKTLTGHGTFHSMGGVRFTTPAPTIPPKAIHRAINPPKTSEIAAYGSMPIMWYKKPSVSGLKAIKLRDCTFSSQVSKEIMSELSLDFLSNIASWAGIESPPSWNGFMRKLYNTGFMTYSKTQIDAIPFINLNPGNLNTIYTALLFAENECKKHGQKSCLVTFDQPLYAKASEIIAAAPLGELDLVTSRLGGFHLLMSFLGSIGYIMAGSGIEELWGQVYASASVPHLVTGHAYSRAVRAHFLTEKALMSLIMAQCFDLNNKREDLVQLINSALDGKVSPSELFNNELLKQVYAMFNEKETALQDSGPTAQLWIQYLQMVRIVHLFLRAERTANWQLHLYCVEAMIPILHAAGHFQYAKSAHLYLQQMKELESKMDPEEYSRFVSNGHCTIRRTSDFWSCISLDMAIEQSLMRLMKVQGGLTHGRGVSDSQLANFILSFPGCMKLCEAVENFTGVSKISTDQHVELRDSRKSVDAKHLNLFETWLSAHSPWDKSSCLRSISSGIVGNEKVNCYKAFEIGRNAMETVIGCNFSDIKLTKKNKVLPLATMTSKVVIRGDVVPVNPQQLFMRIAWVINNNPGDLMKYFKYELAPKPPSLFDDVSIRKTAKSSVATLFDSSSYELFPTSDVIIIDGGYLLRALVWCKPATFGLVIESYVQYISRHYLPKSQHVVVIFDGYNEVLSTKSEEQRRRALKKSSTDIIFDYNTTVTVSQAEFLANSQNKSRFIALLSTYLLSAGLEVRQAKSDADCLIVDTALEKASTGLHISVIATDTDILVMLLSRAKADTNIQLVCPGNKSSLFLIGDIQKKIGHKKDNLLFFHAITGCDTTSAIYGKGKKKAFKLLEDTDTQNIVSVFLNPTVDVSDIRRNGEKFIMKLYSSEQYNSLDELRGRMYARSLAKQPVTASFDLAVLPPTSAACEQHSMRTYLQVQEWLGNKLCPEDWGWKKSGNTLVPVTTSLPPAPDEILNIISCGCKSDCGIRCSCKSAGLDCSMMCTNCKGVSCCNGRTQDEEEDIDDIH